MFKLFPKRHILDSSKLKEFADDNFKFDKNGKNLSKQVENTVELVTSNFSFFHGVFKTFAQQKSKKKGFMGEALTLCLICQFLALPFQEQIRNMMSKNMDKWSRII